MDTLLSHLVTQRAYIYTGNGVSIFTVIFTRKIRSHSEHQPLEFRISFVLTSKYLGCEVGGGQLGNGRTISQHSLSHTKAPSRPSLTTLFLLRITIRAFWLFVPLPCFLSAFSFGLLLYIYITQGFSTVDISVLHLQIKDPLVFLYN